MDEVEQSRWEARDLLRQLGLPAGDLGAGNGVANEVWLTRSHVVRLNSGRFRDAFAYEADVLRRLPAEIPHPVVVAHGVRDRAEGEYLVLERLPGVTLDVAWGALTTGQRHRLVTELAEITRRLHALPPAPWMANPWVADAMAGRYADAYHAPPALSDELIGSARHARPDAAAVLDRTHAFITERLDAFAGDRDVPVHTDLHFRNVLADGDRISGLIDFEGLRLASPDTELDMFLRDLRGDLGGMAVQRDWYGMVPRWFREAYPALFAHPRLIERLEVYEALWHLVQLHWHPAGAGDPVHGLERLLTGEFQSRTAALLG